MSYRRWSFTASVLFMALVATGCSSGGSPSGTQGDTNATNATYSDVAVKGAELTDKEDNMQPERVGRISYDGSNIQATVMSTGCTSPEHFEIVSQANEAGCLVTLKRNKPDFCRRAPFALDIAVAWDAPSECKSDALVFTNPVVDFDKTSMKSEPTRKLQKP